MQDAKKEAISSVKLHATNRSRTDFLCLWYFWLALGRWKRERESGRESLDKQTRPTVTLPFTVGFFFFLCSTTKFSALGA